MIINIVYETQIPLSLELLSFLEGLRTYQHPCSCILRQGTGADWQSRNDFKNCVAVYYYYYYYYYYYLLQFNFHSVAIVLTQAHVNQLRINKHKRNNAKTQCKQYKTQ